MKIKVGVLAVVALVAFGLKCHYADATTDALSWILTPTAHLVGLVTGVYTFGLAGILLGPVLIGLLKAILDTITSAPGWQLRDEDGDDGGASASQVMP